MNKIEYIPKSKNTCDKISIILFTLDNDYSTFKATFYCPNLLSKSEVNAWSKAWIFSKGDELSNAYSV